MRRADSKMNAADLLISFDLPDAYIQKIRNSSHDIRIWQSQDKKRLLNLIADVDILFAGAFSLEMFLAARRLKWIQTDGAGVNKFLFPEVIRSDVIITSAGGVHHIPVSEHVIGLMLSLSRKSHFLIRNQMERTWERNDADLMNQIDELSGKTVGIVGLGRIGKEIARKAKCFEMEVIATRRSSASRKPSYVDKLVRAENLANLLAESDFVVLSLPLTNETKGMLGEVQLKSMKRTAYLINVSRGKIVQERKLIQALKEGWIAGAGLDTFENEPLSRNSELWDMKNVLITPHVAGLSRYYFERLTNIFCKNLIRFTNSKPLINVVNKTLGY